MSKSDPEPANALYILQVLNGTLEDDQVRLKWPAKLQKLAIDLRFLLMKCINKSNDNIFTLNGNGTDQTVQIHRLIDLCI